MSRLARMQTLPLPYYGHFLFDQNFQFECPEITGVSRNEDRQGGYTQVIENFLRGISFPFESFFFRNLRNIRLNGLQFVN